MTSFKVGDIVVVKNSGHQYTTYPGWASSVGATRYQNLRSIPLGRNYTIKKIAPHSPGRSQQLALLESMVNKEQYIYGLYSPDGYLELNNKGEKKMGRRTFRLLKDTPDLKKGALVQEKCDDGNQEYELLNTDDSIKFQDWHEYFDNTIALSRDTVEKQPAWFVEVFPVSSEYITKDELKAFNEFKKTLNKPKGTAKKASK